MIFQYTCIYGFTYITWVVSKWKSCCHLYPNGPRTMTETMIEINLRFKKFHKAKNRFYVKDTLTPPKQNTPDSRYFWRFFKTHSKWRKNVFFFYQNGRKTFGFFTNFWPKNNFPNLPSFFSDICAKHRTFYGLTSLPLFPYTASLTPCLFFESLRIPFQYWNT